MPDLIRHPVLFWMPACAGMTNTVGTYAFSSPRYAWTVHFGDIGGGVGYKAKFIDEYHVRAVRYIQ